MGQGERTTCTRGTQRRVSQNAAPSLAKRGAESRKTLVSTANASRTALLRRGEPRGRVARGKRSEGTRLEASPGKAGVLAGTSAWPGSDRCAAAARSRGWPGSPCFFALRDSILQALPQELLDLSRSGRRAEGAIAARLSSRGVPRRVRLAERLKSRKQRRQRCAAQEPTAG